MVSNRYQGGAAIPPRQPPKGNAKQLQQGHQSQAQQINQQLENLKQAQGLKYPPLIQKSYRQNMNSYNPVQQPQQQQQTVNVNQIYQGQQMQQQQQLQKISHQIPKNEHAYLKRMKAKDNVP